MDGDVTAKEEENWAEEQANTKKNRSAVFLKSIQRDIPKNIKRFPKREQNSSVLKRRRFQSPRTEILVRWKRRRLSPKAWELAGMKSGRADYELHDRKSINHSIDQSTNQLINQTYLFPTTLHRQQFTIKIGEASVGKRKRVKCKHGYNNPPYHVYLLTCRISKKICTLLLNYLKNNNCCKVYFQ